jgi:hypothetical protein
VDPLRAGAVSIIDGRIVHFCSPACRALHLKRADAPEQPIAGAPSPPQEADPRVAEAGAAELPDLGPPDAESAVAVPAPWRASRLVSPFLVPLLVEAGLLALATAAVALVPPGALRGALAHGIAGLAIALSLARGITKERRRGASRLAEVAAAHCAAALLVASSVLAGGSRRALACSLIVLAVEPLARAVEVFGRKRSGVLDVIAGGSASLIPDAWRDNSTTAERVRRIALVLAWGRFVFAGGTGALLFGAGVVALPGALAAASVALLALSTRALKLATGDAHLAVALAASRNGIAIRDAHAVERLGLSRLVVFSARRTLLEPEPKIVDWRVAPGFDPVIVAAHLAALEAKREDRFARAIAAFAESRAAHPLPKLEGAETVPGLGVLGIAGGVPVLCGTRLLFLKRGISSAEHEEWAGELEASGRRAFFVGLDGRVAAMFGVEENPFPGAVDAVRRLSLLGMEPAMITSAEVDAARALGARMGIERVHFEVGEEGTSAVLESMTAAGDTAILVGNGPSFEEAARSATAAIALGGTGTTLADVDMRDRGFDEMVSLVGSARSARASVRGNLTGLAVAIGAGVGLSATWPTPGAAVVSCLLCAAAGTACTINRPFPLASALAGRVSRRSSRLLKVLRARIRQSRDREENRQF